MFVCGLCEVCSMFHVCCCVCSFVVVCMPTVLLCDRPCLRLSGSLYIALLCVCVFVFFSN